MGRLRYLLDKEHVAGLDKYERYELEDLLNGKGEVIVKENKLFVIVYEVQDGEAEWCFKVAPEMNQRRAEQIAIDEYCEHVDYEDDKPSIDDVLGSVWYEQVYAPGYDLKLVKQS